MAALTNKQKDDLNKAILEYLIAYPQTLASFQLETSLTNADASTGDLLSKKWISIIRLQKKVMELEENVNALKAQIPLKYSQNIESESCLPVSPEIKTLEGHRAPITCVTFHPIYTLMSTSSEDGTIKIWDYESGKLEKTLKGHTETVNCVVFNKKGTMLASCSSDITIKLWNCENFECIKTLNGHNHTVSSIFFLGDDFIVSASRDKSIKIWEVATGYCKKTLIGHSDWVRAIAIDSQGELIASASSDQSIILWQANLENALVAKLMEHEHVIECIQFANSNAALTISNSDYYKKKDSRKFLASGSRDKTIKIWDATTFQSVITLSGHDIWVRGLAFHPQGKYLFSCSDDKSILCWDLMSGKQTKRLSCAHTHFITTISISATYPVFATGGVDALIKLWSCK